MKFFFNPHAYTWAILGMFSVTITDFTEPAPVPVASSQPDAPRPLLSASHVY